MFDVVVLSMQDPSKNFVLKSFPRFDDAIRFSSLNLKLASRLGLFLNVVEQEVKKDEV